MLTVICFSYNVVWFKKDEAILPAEALDGKGNIFRLNLL